ncbi:hypothetical protein LTR03_018177, partial [Friedmanniomyces endolithicus]
GFEEGGAGGVQAADGGEGLGGVVEGYRAEGGGGEVCEGRGEGGGGEGYGGGGGGGSGGGEDDGFGAGAGDEEVEVAGHVAVGLVGNVEEVEVRVHEDLVRFRRATSRGRSATLV